MFLNILVEEKKTYINLTHKNKFIFFSYLHAFKRSQVSWLDLFLLFLFWVNKTQTITKALKHFFNNIFTLFFSAYQQISCDFAGRTITVPPQEVWQGKWVYTPPLPSVLKTQYLCWNSGFSDGFCNRRKVLALKIYHTISCPTTPFIRKILHLLALLAFS